MDEGEFATTVFGLRDERASEAGERNPRTCAATSNIAASPDESKHGGGSADACAGRRNRRQGAGAGLVERVDSAGECKRLTAKVDPVDTQRGGAASPAVGELCERCYATFHTAGRFSPRPG